MLILQMRYYRILKEKTIENLSYKNFVTKILINDVKLTFYQITIRLI